MDYADHVTGPVNLWISVSGQHGTYTYEWLVSYVTVSMSMACVDRH